jgi:pimeloyl-ACP methyl ester carboxylesterase
MTDIILHHYDISPYSEKVRLGLGLKGLAWASVECWPQVHIAHLATSQGVRRDEWWTGGNAPLLVIQGLDDIVAPPANGHALRDQLGERVQVVDISRAGHFVIVEQPDPVADAVNDFIRGRRVSPHYRPQEADMTNNSNSPGKQTRQPEGQCRWLPQ